MIWNKSSAICFWNKVNEVNHFIYIVYLLVMINKDISIPNSSSFHHLYIYGVRVISSL